MSYQIDIHKVKYAFVIALYSSVGSYFGQPLIHGNDNAINIIVTVFSILAGFLVAIITIIGDPSSLPSGGWQRARLGSEALYNRLTRHKLLFLMYLTTLLLVFVASLIKEKFIFLDVWIELSFAARRHKNARFRYVSKKIICNNRLVQDVSVRMFFNL